MFYNPPIISKNVFLQFVQIKFQSWHTALGKQVHTYTFICIYFLFGCAGLCRSTQDPVPWPGLEPGPPRWQCGVLATGPPGKSLVEESFVSFTLKGSPLVFPKLCICWWPSIICLAEFSEVWISGLCMCGGVQQAPPLAPGFPFNLVFISSSGSQFCPQGNILQCPPKRVP